MSMGGPSSLRPVAGAAAVNAAAQGLAGSILCVVALCVCFCALGPSPSARIEDNDFAHYITYYLQQDECREHKVALYPSTVTNAIALRIWIALGLFFSASMMVSSVVLFFAVAKGWSDEKLQITLVSWLFINLFTAFDDVILCYVFATDFDLALNWASQEDNVGPLSLALVALLAARGVYLWILNLGSIVYLFFQARALHKYLNEQIKIRMMDQQPIESWPTLDDFEQSKESIIESSMPAAFNPRVENGHVNSSGYPEHSAMARWPAIGATPREQQPREQHRERSRERRRSKTVREQSLRRQTGVDNPGYEAENRYYFRLQGEAGSTRDYEEPSGAGRRSDGHHQRRTSSEPGLEQYRPRPDVWTAGPAYADDHGIPIPPVDYNMDDPSNNKTLSLQEAILDKSLRLKKVPEELRKGFYKY